MSDCVFLRRDLRGRFGAGSVHHIAFRTADDAEQLEYLDQLRATGLRVTPVQDRQYFHSIYFRDPNGYVIELTTPVGEGGFTGADKAHANLADWQANKPAA